MDKPRGLLGRNELMAMKKNAFLINADVAGLLTKQRWQSFWKRVILAGLVWTCWNRSRPLETTPY